MPETTHTPVVERAEALSFYVAFAVRDGAFYGLHSFIIRGISRCGRVFDDCKYIRKAKETDDD